CARVRGVIIMFFDSW
nr:immunoglobulin heavy chain junction region [Macaca mulatta]MOW78336.1 immunoglobulin heavy chain junction region [Macaca mulatta]MOW79031.1 immunoglobulin heavy chain junction region [Macaca mulatta]MOW81724.1 immunoglobulin heavy chain junction region [Macaca mulatta]MOW82747.1 immunoglobulin heavy chain junction region [Macaca mulatta]